MTQSHVLQEFLEQAGITCFAFPGNMYGEKCLAVDLGQDTMGEFIATVINAIAHASELLMFSIDLADVADAFKGMQQEAFGHGTVVYFPHVPYVKNEKS